MSLKFKRHYRLLVLLALVAAVLILGLGDQRIIAYTLQGSEPVVEQGLNDSNAVTLFDNTVDHSFQVLDIGEFWTISLKDTD
jgi:hypothetical protein